MFFKPSSIWALASLIPTLASAVLQPYPSELNSTTAFGKEGTFRLQIRSSNSAFDGHNVQLVPISPYSSVLQVAVANTSAPVALFALDRSILLQFYRDNVNQVHPSGPFGGLRDLSPQGKTREYQFVTVNTSSPEASSTFRETSKQWYLSGGSGSGQYDLFQRTPVGTTSGFLLCGAKGANYHYLIYAETTSNKGTKVPQYCDGGDFVGLFTILAPSPK